MQRDYSMLTNAARSVAVLLALAALAWGQYPGHVETKKKAASSVRAIAVLEWTGEIGKPSASRIIPISVFDGEQYQPGGLYLAKPEPLALEPGTEYVLQDAGVVRGLFDVNTAQDVQGYWFGYGAWKPMAAPVKRVRPPKQGKNTHEVTDAGSGRPHFKGGGSSGDSGSADSSSSSANTSTSSNSQSSDPDRPTLRRRADSSSSSSSDSSSSDSSASNNPPPASDPDRPTLHKHSDSSSSTSSSASNTNGPAPETPIGGSDPDRPHMMHGQQTPKDEYQPAQLTGVPSGLQQMIAVSDAAEGEPHPFVYLWPDPGDAAKMQQQMELAAGDAVAASEPPAKTTAKPHATTTAAQRRKPATPPLPPTPKYVFANERFKAYELTYSGGATLVFSGETQNHAGKVKYVTLIAQPDFNGVPKVLFKSVTDDDHLDITPKMRLVDAVDARANNRGDLIFELRSSRDREFVIYRIASGQAEQVFTTGSLPNS
jgi:hypothetical protein